MHIQRGFYLGQTGCKSAPNQTHRKKGGQRGAGKHNKGEKRVLLGNRCCHIADLGDFGEHWLHRRDIPQSI